MQQEASIVFAMQSTHAMRPIVAVDVEHVSFAGRLNGVSASATSEMNKSLDFLGVSFRLAQYSTNALDRSPHAKLESAGILFAQWTKSAFVGQSQHPLSNSERYD